MTFAVIATGPSLNVEDVAHTQDLRVIAVSDACRLAPWAEVIVSADAAWWKANPEALAFKGKKYGAVHDFQNVPQVEQLHLGSGLNSGLLGIMVAVRMGAKRILLLGFDAHSPGQHFFGEHPKPLKATTPERMAIFREQFEAYQPKGVEIINCTPQSALRCYPIADIRDVCDCCIG